MSTLESEPGRACGRARRRMRVAAAAAAVAAAMVLAACSSNSGSSGGNSSSPAPATSSADSSAGTSAGGSATSAGGSSGGASTASSAGASSASSAPAPAGGELTWALSNSPKTLFAPTNYSSADSAVMSLIQDQLLTYGPDGSLQPSIATSWDAPDPTTYEYTIRTDAVFSDGAPVTPEDVAYSLGLQLDPNVGSLEAALFASVDKISVDGNKVIVKLKHADSLWKFMPGGIGGFVWEKKSVEANLKTYGTPQTLPIGSGPYMVSEFVANSHITLVRNPHYWGTKPRWDKITMKIIPDDQTRLLALRQGDIQGTFAVPNTGIAQWKQAASVTAFSSAIWRGLTLDMEQAPFSDIHVRKALYYATDRNALAQGLLGGLAAVSSTPNDPSMFAGAMADADVTAGYAKIESFDFDLNKAKQELAQSTVPNGFSTTLNVPEDSATAVQLAQALKEDWSKIGVQLKLNMMPGGPRFQVILAHAPNLGVQIIGNAPDGPDPVELAYQYFSSAQAAKNGNNSSNFKDPQVDALLDKASQSTDPKQAAQLIMQAQQLASAQVPVIPLVWQQALVAVKQGWTIQPGFSPFYTTSMWINQIHPNS